jgi:hypothetical protein
MSGWEAFKEAFKTRENAEASVDWNDWKGGVSIGGEGVSTSRSRSISPAVE